MFFTIKQTSFVRSAPLVSIARAAGGTKGTVVPQRGKRSFSKSLKLPTEVQGVQCFRPNAQRDERAFNLLCKFRDAAGSIPIG